MVSSNNSGSFVTIPPPLTVADDPMDDVRGGRVTTVASGFAIISVSCCAGGVVVSGAP